MIKPKRISKTSLQGLANTLPTIKASIKVLGKIYTAEGSTVTEALTNLKPEKGRGVSVLTLSKGDITRTKILNPFSTLNLFHPSATRRQMALKNVISMFSDL